MACWAPEHHASLLQLYRIGFGAWATRRLELRWAWEFEQNPYLDQLPAHLAVRLDGGRVVAFLASYPLAVRLDGVSRVMLCACDMVADPQQGMAALSLFRRLARGRDLLGTAVSPSVLKFFEAAGGHPIPESRTQFVRTLRRGGTLARSIRSRLPRSLARLVRPGLVAFLADPMHLLSVLWRPARAASLRPIDRFDARYDALWIRASAGHTNCVEKSSTYMNWRYLDCPTLTPIIHASFGEDGAMRGVVVAGLRVLLDRHREPCGKVGEILEVTVDPGAATCAEELLEAVVQRLAAAGATSVRCADLGGALHGPLQRNGFVRATTEDQCMAILREDRTRPSGPWSLSRGDGDACMSTTL